MKTSRIQSVVVILPSPILRTAVLTTVLHIVASTRLVAKKTARAIPLATRRVSNVIFFFPCGDPAPITPLKSHIASYSEPEQGGAKGLQSGIISATADRSTPSPLNNVRTSTSGNSLTVSWGSVDMGPVYRFGVII